VPSIYTVPGFVRGEFWFRSHPWTERARHCVGVHIDGEVIVKSWGIWLLILGIGSFILPFFGIQFVLLKIFGDAQVIVAIGMVIAGVVLLVMSSRDQKKSEG
jgi:hypothetical protein